MKKKLVIISLAVFGFMSCAQNQKGPDTGGATPVDQRPSTDSGTNMNDTNNRNMNSNGSNNNQQINTADSLNRQQR